MLIKKTVLKCNLVCPHCNKDDIVYENNTRRRFRAFNCIDCSKVFMRPKRVYTNTTPPPTFKMPMPRAA